MHGHPTTAPLLACRPVANRSLIAALVIAASVLAGCSGGSGSHRPVSDEYDAYGGQVPTNSTARSNTGVPTFEEVFGYTTADFRNVMAQQAGLSCFAELRFGPSPANADRSAQVCHCVEARVRDSAIDWDGIRDAGPRATRFQEVMQLARRSLSDCLQDPSPVPAPAPAAAAPSRTPNAPQVEPAAIDASAAPAATPQPLDRAQPIPDAPPLGKPPENPPPATPAS